MIISMVYEPPQLEQQKMIKTFHSLYNYIYPTHSSCVCCLEIINSLVFVMNTKFILFMYIKYLLFSKSFNTQLKTFLSCLANRFPETYKYSLHNLFKHITIPSHSSPQRTQCGLNQQQATYSIMQY